MYKRQRIYTYLMYNNIERSVEMKIFRQKMHESRNAERGRIMKKTYAKLMTAVLAAASILPAVPTAADETAESTLNVAIAVSYTHLIVFLLS